MLQVLSKQDKREHMYLATSFSPYLGSKTNAKLQIYLNFLFLRGLRGEGCKLGHSKN